MPEQKKKLDVFGTQTDVADVPIKRATEFINEYELEDGSVLRVKSAAVSIVRIEGQFMPVGKPVYAEGSRLKAPFKGGGASSLMSLPAAVERSSLIGQASSLMPALPPSSSVPPLVGARAAKLLHHNVLLDTLAVDFVFHLNGPGPSLVSPEERSWVCEANDFSIVSFGESEDLLSIP